jgi:hypothetical protein
VRERGEESGEIVVSELCNAFEKEDIIFLIFLWSVD